MRDFSRATEVTSTLLVLLLVLQLQGAADEGGAPCE